MAGERVRHPAVSSAMSSIPPYSCMDTVFICGLANREVEPILVLT